MTILATKSDGGAPGSEHLYRGSTLRFDALDGAPGHRGGARDGGVRVPNTLLNPSPSKWSDSDPSDNAVIESFRAHKQDELLNRLRRVTRIELAHAILEYNEGLDNSQGRHSALGNTPRKFGTRHRRRAMTSPLEFRGTGS